jgi:hypothetical protein
MNPAQRACGGEADACGGKSPAKAGEQLPAVFEPARSVADLAAVLEGVPAVFEPARSVPRALRGLVYGG